jgi:hypothetical protein
MPALPTPVGTWRVYNSVNYWLKTHEKNGNTWYRISRPPLSVLLFEHADKSGLASPSLGSAFFSEAVKGTKLLALALLFGWQHKGTKMETTHTQFKSNIMVFIANTKQHGYQCILKRSSDSAAHL